MADPRFTADPVSFAVASGPYAGRIFTDLTGTLGYGRYPVYLEEQVTSPLDQAVLESLVTDPLPRLPPREHERALAARIDEARMSQLPGAPPSGPLGPLLGGEPFDVMDIFRPRPPFGRVPGTVQTMEFTACDKMAQLEHMGLVGTNEYLEAEAKCIQRGIPGGVMPAHERLIESGLDILRDVLVAREIGDRQGTGPTGGGGVPRRTTPIGMNGVDESWFDIPGIDIVGEGSNVYRLAYSPTRAGVRRKRVFAIPNPVTGEADFFGYLGRPLVFSRDVRGARSLKKLARQFAARTRIPRRAARR